MIIFVVGEQFIQLLENPIGRAQSHLFSGVVIRTANQPSDVVLILDHKAVFHGDFDFKAVGNVGKERIQLDRAKSAQPDAFDFPIENRMCLSKNPIYRLHSTAFRYTKTLEGS